MTDSSLPSQSFFTELRAFSQLAIPLASAQVAQVATGFVDTVMMGHLGTQTLAAGAIASITFFALMVTASGVVMGVTPLTAEAHGSGSRKRIEQITRQGLWLSLLLAIPGMLLISHLDTAMRQLGQTEATVSLATAYLDIILWGLFPALGFAMLRGVVSALSNARVIMVIVVIGTVFNIFANYVLGFGKLGFPKLELAGLAIGSALTFWGMFAALVIYLLNHQQFKTYRFFQALHKPRLQTLYKLLKLGVPIGVFYALEIGVYTVISYLIGALGTDDLAAYQIVFQTTNLIFMVPLGMSFAATARVGQWVGRKSVSGIRKAGFVSILAGASWTLLVAATLLLFPLWVVGLYIDRYDPANQTTVVLAVSMMRVSAVAHLFDGIQKIAYGGLQGLQDTQIPMVLSFVAYWCIGLTSGYWLAYKQGMGAVGFWIGLLIAVVIAAVVFIWRFQVLTSKQFESRLLS
ncbi:MATE efflux family protein [Synechococcus sp. PCC 7335]|uniref:MATE family efflux transporter n=1 Tax=Synechococcus sp. (strain ATCC 29403 / PCC 7335) TaxID=91464 RepID=UPI00017EC0DB|nr:MATE family efflux transporter [Synechococcus sp. PCC 7335]EDX82372.1 MATE efflux family protein [Synechococcus sp. PCC 7335]